MSRLGVDCKIIISSIANQEKENKILCIANEEMGAITFNECEFCAEGTSEGSLISEMSSEFVWSSIF